MKFAEYVAWSLLCKHCQFGEKIHCNSTDIKFSYGSTFLVDPIVYKVYHEFLKHSFHVITQRHLLNRFMIW